MESWFELLRNMRNCASRPQDFGQRYDPIFKACQQTSLGENERKQYFRAMISDDEKQGIAEAYREEGFEEGLEAGLKQGMEQGMHQGRERAMLEVAGKLLATNDLQFVSSVTGLSLDILEQMKAGLL